MSYAPDPFLKIGNRVVVSSFFMQLTDVPPKVSERFIVPEERRSLGNMIKVHQLPFVVNFVFIRQSLPFGRVEIALGLEHFLTQHRYHERTAGS